MNFAPHPILRVRFFFASGSFLHPPTFMNPFCRRMARSSAERIVILSHWKEPGTSGTETRQSCRTSFHHGGFHLPFPHFRLFRHTHPHRAVLSPFPHDIYLPTTTRLLTQRFHHHSSHIVAHYSHLPFSCQLTAERFFMLLPRWPMRVSRLDRAGHTKEECAMLALIIGAEDRQHEPV